MKPLDVEILKSGPSVAGGHLSLRVLSGNGLPRLDQFVRESIQNSTDAASDVPGEKYKVFFTYGKFKPSSLNEFLSGAGDNLNGMYRQSEYDFLEVRDLGTCGLDGDVTKKRNEKKHGNFYKLIFEVGAEQTGNLAGGSYGFGKSIFYRIGCGIVIFYTQIKTEDIFEQRMIVTLVEDEEHDSENLVLGNAEDYAGKAWWGIKSGDDILPVTDSVAIQGVLNVFGISPFKTGETGTSVIIPYLKTDELLEEVVPRDVLTDTDLIEGFKKTWTSRIPDYLKLCIQRWYAPRIHNIELKVINKNEEKKWLHTGVNDEMISEETMLPVFKLVRELYNTAYSEGEFSGKEYTDIRVFPVVIRDFSGPCGYVSFIKISRDKLTVGGDDPYFLIGKYNESGEMHRIVVMCARDLGMVIDYFTDGKWVMKSSIENQDEYIFAFFVPVSSKTIKSDDIVKKHCVDTLGSYLRKCEGSDHSAWNDLPPANIVSKIQKGVSGKLKQEVEVNKPVVFANNTQLGRFLGKILLPRNGFEYKAKDPPEKKSKRRTRGKNAELVASSPIIYDGDIGFDFSLKLSSACKDVLLSLVVKSESGQVEPGQWSDIVADFPVYITECRIKEIIVGEDDEKIEINAICSQDMPVIDRDEIKVTLESQETPINRITGIKFSSLQGAKIVGKLKIHCLDRAIRFNFSLK